MKRKIELVNLEMLWECCMLDVLTGEKVFYKGAKEKEFTGTYVRDEKNFLPYIPQV